MPQFDYTAQDPAGNVSQGSVTATTEQDAVRALRAQGYSVTNINRQAAVQAAAVTPLSRQAEGPQRSPFHARVGAKDLAVFFRELFTMLNAGVSLSRALEVQSQATANLELTQILRQFVPRVQGGTPLSSLLSEHPEVFNPLVVGLIRTGETSGGVAGMCQLVSEYQEKEFHLRQAIKRQTFYPKILALAILLIPSVPTLILQGPLAWLGIWLKGLMMASPFVLVAGATWFQTRQYRKTRKGRQAIDAFKLRLPLIGPVLGKLSLAKFCRALAALYKAGIGYAQALPLSADACGNEAIGEGLRAAVPRVEQGEKLSEVFRRVPHFHPMVLQVVMTGEETGNLDTMLDKAADYFESEAETSIHQMTVTIGPILLILAGILVGIRVIGFYTGMLNIPVE